MQRLHKLRMTSSRAPLCERRTPPVRAACSIDPGELPTPMGGLLRVLRSYEDWRLTGRGDGVGPVARPCVQLTVTLQYLVHVLVDTGQRVNHRRCSPAAATCPANWISTCRTTFRSTVTCFLDPSSTLGRLRAKSRLSCNGYRALN